MTRIGYPAVAALLSVGVVVLLAGCQSALDAGGRMAAFRDQRQLRPVPVLPDGGPAVRSAMIPGPFDEAGRVLNYWEWAPENPEAEPLSRFHQRFLAPEPPGIRSAVERP